jgi:hypothetical protein
MDLEATTLTEILLAAGAVLDGRAVLAFLANNMHSSLNFSAFALVAVNILGSVLAVWVAGLSSRFWLTMPRLHVFGTATTAVDIFAAVAAEENKVLVFITWVVLLEVKSHFDGRFFTIDFIGA